MLLPVCNASGARNFFGKGYPFHPIWKWLGLNFAGCGFIAKTTTMESRLRPDKGEGNMRLKADGVTPEHWLPDCIKVNFREPWVLNAVGLSGPGAPALFEKGIWQQMDQYVVLSLMSIQKTASDRLTELTEFVALAKRKMAERYRPWALEINFSCPNVGLNTGELTNENEVGQASYIAVPLGVPIQAKFSVTTPAQAIIAVQESAFNAATIGNTAAWKDIPVDIKQRLFGDRPSPLAKYGGGGLSSPEFVPIVCNTVRELRDSGFHKPIWVGNGFYSIPAIQEAVAANASGVQFGCIGIVRPRGMKQVISYANEQFS